MSYKIIVNVDDLTALEIFIGALKGAEKSGISFRFDGDSEPTIKRRRRAKTKTNGGSNTSGTDKNEESCKRYFDAVKNAMTAGKVYDGSKDGKYLQLKVPMLGRPQGTYLSSSYVEMIMRYMAKNNVITSPMQGRYVRP